MMGLSNSLYSGSITIRQGRIEQGNFTDLGFCTQPF
jgi:hypothetical protein